MGVQLFKNIYIPVTLIFIKDMSRRSLFCLDMGGDDLILRYVMI